MIKMKKMCAALLVGLALGVGSLIHPNAANSQGTGGQAGSAITSSATAVDATAQNFRFQELILGMSAQDARQALQRMGMRITEDVALGIEDPGFSVMIASTSGQTCSSYNQPGICHRVTIHYGTVSPQRVNSIIVQHTSGSYIPVAAIERALVSRYGSPSTNMTLGPLQRAAAGERNSRRLEANWQHFSTRETVSFRSMAPGVPVTVDNIAGLQSFTIEIYSPNFRREAESAFIDFVRRQPVPNELRF